MEHRRRREELEQQLWQEATGAESAAYQAFAAEAEAEAQVQYEERRRNKPRRQSTEGALEYLRK